MLWGGGGKGYEKKNKKKTLPNGVGDKISFMIPWEGGGGVIDMISFSGFKMIWLLGDAPPKPIFTLKFAFSSEK